MGIQANIRVRLTAAALLVAVAAGCGGGGGGGGGALPEEPLAPLPPPEAGPAPIPQVLAWGFFPAANVVIGQHDFVSGDRPGGDAGLDRLDFPEGMPGVAADRTLFVAAVGGLRAFRTYDAGNGPTSAFNIVAAARSASIQGTKMVYVVDNEVRIHDTPPENDSAPADVTVGGIAGCAPDRLNTPRHAIVTPGGRLVVADTMNNRVLIWNAIPRAGEGADFVVGQDEKDECEPNDLNQDGSGDGQAHAHTLNSPTSVWSDDVNLVVVDRGNHRVLIYDFPTVDGAQARTVLGQQDVTDQLPNAGQSTSSDITLLSPESVDVRESGQMAVADSGNHRVLVWDTFPVENGQAANQVIGQSAFGRNAANAGGTPSANSLQFPSGVRFHERNLIVTDKFNHRVLVFPSKN